MDLMPAFFFGHGNPMNALSRNSYTEAWKEIGREIPPPKAVLAISAHWYIPACAVTANPSPPTIHDFGGFPKELFAVQYPAPGSPELARRVQELISPLPVELDDKWGIDHGTWSVLTHVFPEADIPVVQLAIDRRQPPGFHHDLGKRLSKLREEGVLIIGSGNLVHNLQTYAWGDRSVQAFDWGVRFENRVRELILKGDDDRVVAFGDLGPDALLSVPTPDHFLPLLYILGVRRKDDRISFPVQGVDGGSVSMLSMRIG